MHVVVVIGRAFPPGPLRHLECCPSQSRRPLPAELARRSLLVGAVDGDVEAGVTYRLLRARKASGVTQLREQGYAGKLPDTIMLHKCLTTGLGAGIGPELCLYRLELLIYVIDHCQRKVHHLPGSRRKLHIFQVGATFNRVQILLLGIAIMEELGVDALLMSRTLLVVRSSMR